MNKLLRYSFVALMAMIGMNVMADDVVIDFNKMDLATSSGESTAGDITEAKTFEQEGVTVTISPKAADASNENRFWSTNNGPQLRCYSGSITIKANSTMKTIVFDAPSKFNMTADKGAINSQTWTGEANEVVFAVGGNTQINKITISAEASEVPTIEEITVAKAIELCNALGDGATSESEYKVKGFVVGKPAIDKKKDSDEFYGNAKFYLADEKGGSPTIYAYQIYGLNNEKMNSEDYLKDGDEVVVQCKLQKYVKNETVTPELVKGYLLSLVSGGSQEAGQVWDFTVLPTQAIDGTGNIETNVEGGILPEDGGESWSAFYNKDAIDGAEFMNKAGETLELTKGLKWYINGAKKVYYRNYPVESGGKPYGGKYIFINDGDNSVEICVPAEVGQQIEIIASTAKNNKKITSQDVAETFETTEGETLHGVVIDGTTNYDWKPYTLTVTAKNPFLKFEKNACIQKITVKDATGISVAKSNVKANNGVIYNLAGQKVGKDYKGIVIMNGKKVVMK